MGNPISGPTQTYTDLRNMQPAGPQQSQPQAQPPAYSSRRQQYSPGQLESERSFLHTIISRMKERGARDQEVYNYLNHYEGVRLGVMNALKPSLQAPPTRGEGIRQEIFGVTSHIVETMAFGQGDEVFGSIYGLAAGIGMEEGRKYWREQMAEFAKKYPAAATGAELAGGLVGAGTIGLRAFQRVAATKSIPKLLGVMAGEGALFGGLQGAGMANTEVQTQGNVFQQAGQEIAGQVRGRTGPAVRGAAIGAAAAPVLGGAFMGTASIGQGLARGTGLVTGASNLWRRMFNKPLPFVNTAGQQSREIFMQAMAKDKVSLTTLLGRARQAAAEGKPVGIADLLPEATNVQELVTLSAGLRDPAKQNAVQILTDRQLDSGPRMLARMSELIFGGTRVGLSNARTVARELGKRFRADAAPLYEAANAQTANVGATLREVLRLDPRYRTAWNKAHQDYLLARANGTWKSTHAVPTVDEVLGGGIRVISPAVPASTVPHPYQFGQHRIVPGRAAVTEEIAGLDDIPIAAINEWKRTLNEALTYDPIAVGGSQLASQRDKELVTGNLYRVVNEATDQVEVYGRALETFGDGITLQHAVQDGVDLFPKFKDADEVLHHISTLKGADVKAGFRLGALQSYHDKIAAEAGKTRDWGMFFGGRANRRSNTELEKIKALFPNQALADEAAMGIHLEASMTETFERAGQKPINKNSRERLSELTESLMPGMTGRGGLTMRAGGIPSVFARVWAKPGAGWNQEVSDELSELFLQGIADPQDLESVIHELASITSRRFQRKISRRVVVAAVAGQQPGAPANLILGRPNR